jgi:hypothetical protein
MMHRMYIDEVGNSDLDVSEDPNRRYLSLSGVIFELDHIADCVHPRLESLKRKLFGQHPDDPLILHRKELINKKYPFQALRNPEIEQEFNEAIIGILVESKYTVITSVIDKSEHARRYETWVYNPYHYCMAVILERYVMWLARHGRVGDVLAESRGGREDIRLKESFREIYNKGTDFMNSEQFQKHLTSKELKIKPKSKNIAGLQIADLIAYPSYRATLARHLREDLADNFGGRIAKILEDQKYDRDAKGSPIPSFDCRGLK